MEGATSNIDNKELNKLRLVFEQTPGAIFILDKEFRFEYVNPSFEQLSGYAKADLLDKTVKELFYHEEIQESRREVVEAMLKGEKWQGELLTHNKNGNTYWANTIAAPFKDENGALEGYIMIQQDITEKKKLENALRESEVKYRLLFSAESDAIFMIDAETGQILDANPATSSIYGYSHDELLTMKNTDVSAEPDKTTEATSKDITLVPYRLHKRKDGTIFPVELSAGFTNFKNRKIQIVTSRDITERIKTQEALAKSEQKYRELTEMLPLTVYELDVYGKPTYMNRTGLKLFGWNEKVAPNVDATSFFSPNDKKLMQQRLEEEANKIKSINKQNEPEPSSPEEYTAINSNGQQVPVVIYGSPIIENGKAVGSRGVIVDISERKAMENALRKSEQKYRELADFLPQTIYELDSSGNIVYVNKTGMEIFGLSENDYGKSCVDLFVENDQKTLIQNMQIILQGLTTELMYEYTAHSRNGRIFPVLTYSLPVNREGKVVGLRGMVLDISERKATEKALLESEKKYRELAEMLPQAVYELDLNANLKYLNKAGREKFGTAYETTDVSVFSIVVPEQLERMRQNFMNVSFNNIPSKGNFYKLKQKDGQVFEAMISATSMIENGKPIGSRGIVVDISDHVAMQKALAESEEKYRTVIEKATDGIVITQQGKLVFMNESMCNMVQYSKDELIGTSFLDIIVPDEHSVMIDFHKRRMAGEDFSALYRSKIIRKDGKILIIELNARTSNYNGAPAAFIIVRDITDRLKIENELQLAKTELETLNSQLEKRVKESSKRLVEARTQLINMQKENLQSQFEVLKQQVNPHFLFNSLNVLTSLIKLEPDLAEKFSEQLSKVYRYVLENKDNELVELNTELNFLEAYIFLLNIRFVGKLNVNVNIPAQNRNDKIIPLAMQLLIENAIKHNVMSKNNPLVIDIFIDKNNCLNILNNLQERPSQIVSTGVGLKNILNRYKLLELPLPTFDKTENQFIAKIQLIKNTTPNS